jgi:hypothetical protein
LLAQTRALAGARAQAIADLDTLLARDDSTPDSAAKRKLGGIGSAHNRRNSRGLPVGL